MVRAILEGRKSMTRRIFKVTNPFGKKVGPICPPEEIIRFEDGSYNYLSTGGLSGPYQCPHGVPGDRLWVRESFGIEDGRVVRPSLNHPMSSFGDEVFYRSNDPNLPGMKWKPSIHMPRALSRITLEITDVRVERVQEISIEDMDREGVDLEGGIAGDAFNEAEHFAIGGCPMLHHPEIYGFAALWDSINGKKHPWDSNPWVWVISFKRINP
jgi:hypothetical protein